MFVFTSCCILLCIFSIISLLLLLQEHSAHLKSDLTQELYQKACKGDRLILEF